MKRELIRYTDAGGDDITLFAVKIRKDGTREVFDGILLHNNRFKEPDNDYLTGGVVGMNEPETAAEAEQLTSLSQWTKDFYIDGNGYYIYID